MRAIRFRRFDWILLTVAIVLVTWPALLIPLPGFGKVSFASGYNKVHIGMPREKWESLQREYGVQAVCDSNDCYIEDVFRTYNVNSGLGPDGEYVVLYKRTYFRFPLGRLY